MSRAEMSMSRAEMSMSRAETNMTVGSSNRVREALELLARGSDLPRELAVGIVEDLLNGVLTPTQVGGLLFGLKMKGESAQEIAAFVEALRRVCRRIPAPADAVDTCGTGGDGAGTFNISTTAAFVVAGAGVPVAKHGNRFASGKCGSADVLEQLGVPLDLTPEESAQTLAEQGIAFLFAPLYHPAMAKVAVHRRELGVRTIFNLLGPLLNPAQTRYQLIGVSSRDYLSKMAEALKLLGIKRAVVVTGEDGLDEVSLTGITHALVIEEEIRPLEIVPEDYGFKRCSLAELRGGTPAENAQITLDILQGKPGPQRDIVVLNAGVALYASCRASTIAEGIEMARHSLDSGKAYQKLQALRDARRVKTN